MKMLALFLACGLTSFEALADDARWQLAGVEPERAEVSWNKDDFVRLPGDEFELTVKVRFFRPEAIPGSQGLPPATISLTRYAINCRSGDLQPINGRFLDASGGEIARLDQRGPVHRAQASGGKTRDRIFDSFCTAMKTNPGPRRLP